MIIPNSELKDDKNGFMWMWRHCCLQKMVNTFQIKEEKGSKIIITKYHWCLTRDSGNITVTGRKQHDMTGGINIFSSLYE